MSMIDGPHDPMMFRYPEELQNEAPVVASVWPLYLSGIAAFGLVLLVI